MNVAGEMANGSAQSASSTGLSVLAFGAGLLSLVPIAALFGGSAFLMMILAAALAVWVWSKPQEAPSTGILFLISCNVLLPSAARYDWSWRDAEPWQLYYWAAGLLIITVTALVRIGVRQVLLGLPTSAKALLLVAFIATIVGFARGNALSFVVRQLYGTLLLLAYFAIAIHVGNIEVFLRRLRTFGLLLAAAFFVYYAAEFNEYGFHKELTTLGTMEGSVAILCFAQGLGEKGRGWLVAGLVLMLVPVLLFERRVFFTVAVAMALVLAMRTASKRARIVYLAIAILGILPGVLVSGAGFVLEKINSIPGVADILPAGGADVNSLTDRTVQLGLSAEILAQSPLFGQGFGAEIFWDRPYIKEFVQQAYIDNGWAYLAVKMGGLGIVVFGWFLVTTLRCVSREVFGVSACLLSLLLVTMFTEPVVFNFSTSALVGSLAGLLYARRARSGAAQAKISWKTSQLELRPLHPKGT